MFRNVKDMIDTRFEINMWQLQICASVKPMFAVCPLYDCVLQQLAEQFYPYKQCLDQHVFANTVQQCISTASIRVAFSLCLDFMYNVIIFWSVEWLVMARNG